jgi:hypothetical protein
MFKLTMSKTYQTQFPDLYIKGDARIKKKIIAENLSILGTITVPKILTTCVNGLKPDTGVTIEGVLIKNGKIYGDLVGTQVTQITSMSSPPEPAPVLPVKSPILDNGQIIITNTNTSKTVNSSFIQDSAQVFLTLVNPSPSGPVVAVGDIVNGVSFTLDSDIPAGLGGITVNWMIIG